MTREELAAQIEKDIRQKGGAHVPIGIIQEIFSPNTHVITTLDAALEEFADNHDWRIRHDALPTPRVIFYPVKSAEKVLREEGRK